MNFGGGPVVGKTTLAGYVLDKLGNRGWPVKKHTTKYERPGERDFEYRRMSRRQIEKLDEMDYYVRKPRYTIERGFHLIATPKSSKWGRRIPRIVEVTVSIFHLEANKDLKTVPNCYNFYVDVNNPDIIDQRLLARHPDDRALREYKRKVYQNFKDVELGTVDPSYIPIFNDTTLEEAVEQIDHHIGFKLIG